MSVRQVFLSDDVLAGGLVGPHLEGFAGDVVAFVAVPLTEIAAAARLSPQRTWEEGLGECWFVELELPSGRRAGLTDHDGGVEGTGVALMGRSSFDWDEAFDEFVIEMAIAPSSVTWRQSPAVLALHGATMWGSDVSDFAFVLESASARVLTLDGSPRPIMEVGGQYRAVVIRDDRLRADVVAWLLAEGVQEIGEWPTSSPSP